MFVIKTLFTKQMFVQYSDQIHTVTVISPPVGAGWPSVSSYQEVLPHPRTCCMLSLWGHAGTPNGEIQEQLQQLQIRLNFILFFKTFKTVNNISLLFRGCSSYVPLTKCSCILHCSNVINQQTQESVLWLLYVIR